MNNGPSVWGHPTGLCLARKGRGYPGGDVGAQRLLEGGQGSPRPGKQSVQGRILLFLPPPSLSFPICSSVPQTRWCVQRRCALSLAGSQGLELSPAAAASNSYSSFKAWFLH